jgi:hypothetical protein
VLLRWNDIKATGTDAIATALAEADVVTSLEYVRLLLLTASSSSLSNSNCGEAGASALEACLGPNTKLTSLKWLDCSYTPDQRVNSLYSNHIADQGARAISTLVERLFTLPSAEQHFQQQEAFLSLRR